MARVFRSTPGIIYPFAEKKQYQNEKLLFFLLQFWCELCTFRNYLSLPSCMIKRPHWHSCFQPTHCNYFEVQCTAHFTVCVCVSVCATHCLRARQRKEKSVGQVSQPCKSRDGAIHVQLVVNYTIPRCYMTREP